MKLLVSCHSRMVLVICFLILLSGCAPNAPTRYYVIRSLDSPESEQNSGILLSKNFRLGVNPVRVPGYLDRSSLVLKKGKNELVMEQSDEWGEPLKDNLSRALLSNLGLLLGHNRVVGLPSDSSEMLSHKLDVHLLSFESDDKGKVTLAVEWSIELADKGTNAVYRQTKLSCQAELDPKLAQPEEKYPSVVFAMNSCIDKLSLEIAQSCRGL